jgi:apolipoprotein N-acyltransferase
VASTTVMPAAAARTAVAVGEQSSVRAAYAAGAGSGVLIALCFLRFELFPLAWVAFTPLLWALSRARSGRQAAAIGFVAGFVTNLPAFYWLVYTIHVFGGFGYGLSLLFYVCLTAFTACQFVLFALALRYTGPGPLAVAAPLVWVSLEFLYPNLFPWRMANCQLRAPVLLQIGDVTGPYGLSFVMVWVAAGLAALLERRRRVPPVFAAAAATLAVIAYGAFRLPAIDAALAAAPSLRVALVQGNVSIEEKGDVRYFAVNLDRYARLSEDVQGDVDLIVWPETDATRLEGQHNPFEALQRHLIFGGLAYRLTGPRQADEFNSSFLMAPDGVVLGRYDKRILMPFGEYLPLSTYFPAIRKISPQTGGYTAGTTIGVFDIGGKAKVGQLICYEDLVSSMSRDSTRAGADVLLNILNDAWYGDTAAPHQHQALALWRAIENRRYLLRGSNTGVTSIIDPAGRVAAEGGVFREEVVSGTVHPLQLETFYTRHGDVFVWLVLVATGGLLVLRRVDERGPGGMRLPGGGEASGSSGEAGG